MKYLAGIRFLDFWTSCWTSHGQDILLDIIKAEDIHDIQDIWISEYPGFVAVELL